MERGAKGSWPFNERSTRNCIHCKTVVIDGIARAYCSKGKPLSLTKQTMSLKAVLTRAIWVSGSCRHCHLFEHDVESAE